MKYLDTPMPTPFKSLSTLLTTISHTPKRTTTTTHLSSFLTYLKHHDPSTLIPTLHLVHPTFDLGIGDTLLTKIVSQSTSKSVSAIKALYAKEGDLGTIASRYKTKPLTHANKNISIQNVYDSLCEVARMSTNCEKMNRILSLVVDLTPAETKFLIRIVEGRLKVGLALQTVLSAIGECFEETECEYEYDREYYDRVYDERDCKEKEECKEIGDDIKNNLKNNNKNNNLKSNTNKTNNNKNNIKSKINYAYGCQPRFETLITALLTDTLDAVTVQPGVPVRPMLAQATRQVSSAFARIGERVACDFKYDGERAQIHFFDGQVKIFSRNGEDLSEKYPEIVRDCVENKIFRDDEYVRDCIEDREEVNDISKDMCNDLSNDSSNDSSITTNQSIPIKNTKTTTNTITTKNTKTTTLNSYIIDAEIVAFNRVSKKILPFQTLATRKRKNVRIADIAVDVCVFAFDVLFLGGSLILDDLAARRRVLTRCFRETDAFRFAEFRVCGSPEEVEAFFHLALRSSCEGVILKDLARTYVPSVRCSSWIKLKKDYVSGMADTLDLVVLGCYHGRGKRGGLFGGFLMGCFNDEQNVFETVCKLGTGFDEESLGRICGKLRGVGVDSLGLDRLGGLDSGGDRGLDRLDEDIEDEEDIKEDLKEDIYKEDIYTEEIDKDKKIIDQDIVKNAMFSNVIPGSVTPDIWVRPELVWEVQAAGLSVSPVYSAGGGISLRFPRFVRERSDKKPWEATTSRRVVEMMRSGCDDFDDEEYV